MELRIADKNHCEICFRFWVIPFPILWLSQKTNHLLMTTMEGLIEASITALVAKIDNTVDITDCFSSLWKMCLQQTTDVIRNEKWITSYSAHIFGKVIWVKNNSSWTATQSFLFFIRRWTKKGAEEEADRIREIAFTKTITVFLLLSRTWIYLVPKILGTAFVTGQRLKEGCTYFKVKKAKQVKF